MGFKLGVCVLLTLVAGSLAVPYIVGGGPAKKGAWPWMLSLEVQAGSTYRHQCGASLITSRWAVTAAHCLYGEPKCRVLLGAIKSSPKDDATQTIKVDKYIVHPKYDNMGKGIPNDIALLHLSTEADLTDKYVATIALPKDGEDFVGNKDCWLTGWGVFKEGSWEHSPYLKQLQTPALTNSGCQTRFDKLGDDFYTILKTHICANNTGEAGPCNMDSGGPFHCDRGGGDWVLAGALSWGGDPCSHYPGVYTRVSSYLDWIREHVPGV